MSTRSFIHVHRRDGKWASIYSHSDGYLSWNGRILFEHYKDLEKVEALVALGDVSSLAETILCPPGHTFDKRVEGCTIFYNRDRGEKHVDCRVGDSLQDVWRVEDYMYVFMDNEWFVTADDDIASLVRLQDLLLEQNIIVSPEIRRRAPHVRMGRAIEL